MVLMDDIIIKSKTFDYYEAYFRMLIVPSHVGGHIYVSRNGLLWAALGTVH